MKQIFLLIALLFFQAFSLLSQESGSDYNAAMVWIGFNLDSNGYNSETGSKVDDFKFDGPDCNITIVNNKYIQVYTFSIKDIDLSKTESIREFLILRVHPKKTLIKVKDSNNAEWQTTFCEIPLKEAGDMHQRMKNALENAINQYYKEFDVPQENRY